MSVFSTDLILCIHYHLFLAYGGILSCWYKTNMLSVGLVDIIALPNIYRHFLRLSAK
jgi:hypothetical protein